MEWTIKSAILIGLFYGIYKVILQNQTFFQWNRIFFGVGILAAVVLPFIEIPVYKIVEVPYWEVGFNRTLPVTAITNKTKAIDWTQVFIFLYVLGFTVMLIRFLIHLLSVFMILKKLPKRKWQKYFLSETEEAPITFSFFNRIVINPRDLTKKERESLLQHEKIHASQYHTIDVFLTHFLLLFQWFNPFAWLYKKEMEKNLEFIADSETQKTIKDNKAYQMLLLKTTYPNYQLALANNFNASLIKKRIKMLHQKPSKHRQKWKYLIILPVVLFFIYSFNRVEIPQPVPSFPAYTQGLYELPINISMTLTKDNSDKDLETIKKSFKAQGVIVKFTGVKRNRKGEITAIEISAETENSKTSFASETEQPIEPIVIRYDSKEDRLEIGYAFSHSSDMFIYSEGIPGKNKMRWIKNWEAYDIDSLVKGKLHIFMDSLPVFYDKIAEKWEGQGNHFVFIDSLLNGIEDEWHIDSLSRPHIFIKKLRKNAGPGSKYKIHVDSSDDDTHSETEFVIVKSLEDEEGSEKTKTFFFSYNSDDKNPPLYILNGKEITKAEMDKLDPDTIEEIEVLKGKKAKKKYGEKAKNGVVIITTRDKD